MYRPVFVAALCVAVRAAAASAANQPCTGAACLTIVKSSVESHNVELDHQSAPYPIADHTWGWGPCALSCFNGSLQQLKFCRSASRQSRRSPPRKKQKSFSRLGTKYQIAFWPRFLVELYTANFTDFNDYMHMDDLMIVIRAVNAKNGFVSSRRTSWTLTSIRTAQVAACLPGTSLARRLLNRSCL